CIDQSPDLPAVTLIDGVEVRGAGCLARRGTRRWRGDAHAFNYSPAPRRRPAPFRQRDHAPELTSDPLPIYQLSHSSPSSSSTLVSSCRPTPPVNACEAENRCSSTSSSVEVRRAFSASMIPDTPHIRPPSASPGASASVRPSEYISSRLRGGISKCSASYVIPSAIPSGRPPSEFSPTCDTSSVSRRCSRALGCPADVHVTLCVNVSTTT